MFKKEDNYFDTALFTTGKSLTKTEALKEFAKDSVEATRDDLRSIRKGAPGMLKAICTALHPVKGRQQQSERFDAVLNSIKETRKAFKALKD